MFFIALAPTAIERGHSIAQIRKNKPNRMQSPEGDFGHAVQQSYANKG